MSLFTTDPVVANDGTADHSFTFISQLPDSKQVIGEYVEKAAASPLASKLVVKHDTNGASIRRRLFSRRLNVLSSDGVTYKPVTINYSIAYDREHDTSVIETQCHDITVALISKAEFFGNWVVGSI